MKQIFNPPKWCNSYSFIIEFGYGGNHITSMAKSELELIAEISQKYRSELTSLSVDVICCGHNQGQKDQRQRRQIKKLWQLDFTKVSEEPNQTK